MTYMWEKSSETDVLSENFFRGAGRPRGNVLASRSKVRGFKPDWGRWIISGRKNPEHKSTGRDFNLEVPSLSFQARYRTSILKK